MLRTPPVRLVISFLVPVAIAAVVTLRSSSLRGLFVIVAVLSLAGLALRLRARVVLRPDRIEVVSLRSWQTPWSQVLDVRVGPKGARGNPSVFVSDATGSRELLALRSIGDTDRVRAQGAVVEQWWKAAQDREQTTPPG